MTEICKVCGLDDGCDACYKRGYIDMCKAFESQIENSIGQLEKTQRLSLVQKVFIKTTLQTIVVSLKKAIEIGI